MLSPNDTITEDVVRKTLESYNKKKKWKLKNIFRWRWNWKLGWHHYRKCSCIDCCWRTVLNTVVERNVLVYSDLAKSEIKPFSEQLINMTKNRIFDEKI